VISTRWLDQRTPHWRQLESLLDRISTGGFRALTRSELQELGVLYRQIAADLATVREDPGSARFAASLNQLLARAHHTIYSAERPSASLVVRFVTRTFPRTFRALSVHCLIALLLFLAGAAVGATLTYRDPEFKAKVLGPQMVETIERREMWTHSIVAMKPLASSRIATNNLGVSFLIFATGIIGGLGTAYLLVFNGIMIGVVGTACAMAGMSVPLWSFVAPHGAWELPAIFIAGGAGLRLGQGVLFPGFLPRRDAIARAGAQSLSLILGCVPILIVAGLVEGFISPTDLPVPLKFALGAAMGVLLAWYLVTRGVDAPTPGSAV
jgi:uncharacterized membrane protein SpoIIM required for sporulation